MRLCSAFVFQAISTRDAMSKCLYSALFDWIVFQINAALVSKHDRREHEVMNAFSEISAQTNLVNAQFEKA